MSIQEEEQLAEKFEASRARVVKGLLHLFPMVSYDIIDMLYTDCWLGIRDAARKYTIKSWNEYVWRSVRNRVYRYLHRLSTSEDLMDRGERAELTDNGYEEAYIDSRPWEAEAAEESAALIQALMARMPRTLRLVGQWYYVDELSLTEVAARLKCSKTSAHRMLVRFRRLMTRRGAKLREAPQPIRFPL